MSLRLTFAFAVAFGLILESSSVLAEGGRENLLRPMTVEAAIAEAKAQSPELAKARADLDQASSRRLEALSAYLPHLSAGADYLLSTQYMNLSVLFNGTAIAFPAAVPQTILNLDGSIQFFDGFEGWNRYRAAVLGYEASQLDFARADFNLTEQVRMCFYRALASDAMLAVSDENIKSLKEHLGLADAMIHSGYLTKFDTLRVSALLEEAQAERLLTQDNGVRSRKALYQEIGVEDDGRAILGILPIPDEKTVSVDLKFDPVARPDLQALSRRDDALGHLDSASSGFWWPHLSFFVEEQFYQFGNFNPLILPSSGLQNAYSVGFRLSWNLFDGGASIARSQAASAAADREKQMTRVVALKAPDDFDDWKRRYFYNVALYKARQRSVDKSTESVRLARAAVQAGTRTSTEFLDAELDLFRARAGLVQSQADAAEARIQLELNAGKEL